MSPSSSNLFILGATGGTGKQLVAQALEAGHDVVALVRDPAKAPPGQPRLRVVIGDILTDPAPLAEALRGRDAVVSALGVGRALRPGGLIARGTPVLIDAMRGAGVRRLVYTSAIGVGDSFADAPLFSRTLIRVLLRNVYEDKAAGEESVQRSGLDWTIVQPAQLTDGPLTGSYLAGEGIRHRGMPRISRADVAHFLLGRLADSSSIGKILRIGYR